MDYNNISNYVINEINRAGFGVKEIKSQSTNSIYFKMFYGEESLIFRVSDHKANTSIVTFRVDRKKHNFNDLNRFVQNRIKDLRYRNLKSILGM